MIKKKIMSFALSCIVFVSACNISFIPTQAVVRDNVGGMDTSVPQEAPTEKGGASANEILEGYGAWVNGELIPGAMEDYAGHTNEVNVTGNTTKVEDGNVKIAIPAEGHYDTDSLLSVKASDLIKTIGKDTALSDSTTISVTQNGLNASNGASVSGDFTKGFTITPAENKLLNSISVKGDTNLISANIKSGTSIFGVSGKTSVVDTEDANATAAQILKGQTAYVNGAKVEGSMANYSENAIKTYEITGNTITKGIISKNIDTGYHNGSTIKIAATNSITYNKEDASDAALISGDDTNAYIKLKTGNDNTYAVNGTEITVPIETLKKEVTSLNSSLIINALQDKSKEFDNLDINASCPEIATAIKDSNLSKNISFTFVATQSGNGQRTLNVSGYKQYLCCDIFYASNDNPLDWGCTTSIGSVDRICSQLSSYCGMSVYLVTTNYTGSVTITMNGHNKNIVNIYGINL